MTFLELIEQIKTEARVKSDDEFNSVIIGLLNEGFTNAVLSQRPFELRNEVTLAFADTTGYVNLPSDFLVHHSVDFVDEASGRVWPLADEDTAVAPAPRGFTGHPKQFEIEGSQIKVRPVTSLNISDTLLLKYYQKPPIITVANLSTANPITRLEPYLITSCIRRVRMLHSDDTAIAQMLQGDISAAAKGYMKDEPQPPPPTP